MQVVDLREIVMILELKRQGLGVSPIARQTRLDRKAVRQYLARTLRRWSMEPRKPEERLTEEAYQPRLQELNPEPSAHQ